MILIKRFIDKVSTAESKKNNTLVLTMEEARMLRDEISKLIADNYEMLNKQQDAENDTVIQVEINGGKW